MGTQHAQKGVVKRSTSREKYVQNTVEKHAQSQMVQIISPRQTCTRAVTWNRMHVHATMCVCVCAIITQVYSLPDV